jgi:hypothetical protein
VLTKGSIKHFNSKESCNLIKFADAGDVCVPENNECLPGLECDSKTKKCKIPVEGLLKCSKQYTIFYKSELFHFREML